jgi:hypothetical protein
MAFDVESPESAVRRPAAERRKCSAGPRRAWHHGLETPRAIDRLHHKISPRFANVVAWLSEVSTHFDLESCISAPLYESVLALPAPYLAANQAWVEQFLDEVCSFPAAPHDDWLDAFTQALNYLRPLENGRGSVQAFIRGWEEAQKRLADPSYRNPMEQIYGETTRRLQARSHCSFRHGPIPSGTSYIDERHFGRIHVARFYKRQNRPG